jgi:hypothetical protein
VQRVALFVAGLALAGALGVGGFLLFADDEEDRSKLRPRLAKEAPLGPLGLSAHVLPGRQVVLRARPGGQIVRRIGDTTEFGSPEALSPISRRGNWFAVRHTSLGNRGVAWVDARSPQFKLRRRVMRLDVDLSERELSVFFGGRLARRIPVAVGAPETPTPPGEYYVTDKLRGADFGPFYGCCILALSGRQPNLPRGWSGGDRLAIHGSPTPTWGHNVSNGCLHARVVDLRYLMRAVPLGTVVTIRA